MAFPLSLPPGRRSVEVKVLARAVGLAEVGEGDGPLHAADRIGRAVGDLQPVVVVHVVGVEPVQARGAGGGGAAGEYVELGVDDRVGQMPAVAEELAAR